MQNLLFIYPAPLKAGSRIGVAAPSGGVHERFANRFNLALKHLTDQGYEIVEGECLRNEYKHVSGPKKERAEDFMALWMREDIDAIIPPWGGELLIEILPLLDFEKMKTAKPKWLMGYSDISTLLFPLTLLTNIVSVHGTNLMEMVPAQTDYLTKNCLNPLTQEVGTSSTQVSSDFFQIKGPSFTDEYELGLKPTEKTIWKTLDNKSCSIKGRIIGGCLDTISSLVGTAYANLDHLKKLASNEGVILYFENCELSPCDVARKLWTMRLAGWFEGLNGVILGRSSGKDSNNPNNLSYKEVISDFFNELNIPLIYDVDIGHQQPNLTILNGSLVEFSVDESGKGTLVTKLI